MKEEVRGRVLHIVTIALLLVVIVGGMVKVYPEWRRGVELRRKEAELDALIAKKNAEIAKLAENQRRFRTDPNFVEMIARRNRRVYPGEYVFIFED